MDIAVQAYQQALIFTALNETVTPLKIQAGLSGLGGVDAPGVEVQTEQVRIEVQKVVVVRTLHGQNCKPLISDSGPRSRRCR